MKKNFVPNICWAKSGVISNSRDEEMKKKFVPNICQAKSGVISNSRDEK